VLQVNEQILALVLMLCMDICSTA